MKHSNKKNIFSLIAFMLLFGHANAQNKALADTCDKSPTKTENVVPDNSGINTSLMLRLSGNVSQTYNGIHADLLPVGLFKANANIGHFSAFARSVGCFTSLPAVEQKYKLLIGELCFGGIVSFNDNSQLTLTVGKFSFAGPYGLATHAKKFASTDVLYDMFKVNNDKTLNRGTAITYSKDGFNISCGYTEQDNKSGLAFNGKNSNVLLSCGYEGKVFSVQFIGFYSVKEKDYELNFYALYIPNNRNMFICKVLGIASTNPMFEMVYTHSFNKLTLSAVAIADKNKFADVNIVCILPCNVSVNIGVTNNDPYFENKGLNPKIGVGYLYQFNRNSR